MPNAKINLLRGWPSASLLPTLCLRNASAAVLSSSSPRTSILALQYGPDAGYAPLREQLARFLSDFYLPTALALTAHQRICITGGASQNLACLLQVFSDPGATRVCIVAPCYFLACRVFADAALRCIAVAEGPDGVDLLAMESALSEERQVKPLKRPTNWSKIYKNIIYCVPTFSNPSGKTMPLATRESLVRLARKYDALLISDDVYDFLHWPTSDEAGATTPLPRLVDIDRTLTPTPGPADFGNAVSNGSFSKIVGPGVRTGWAEATPTFIYGLSQCGSSRSGGAPSQFAAAMMSELLASGDLQGHIERVLRPAYCRRWRAMRDVVERELIPLGVRLGIGSENMVFGGYFLWIKLPQEISAKIVADRALACENLVVAPGEIFEVEGDSNITFSNSMRLCFSWEPEELLVEGVERLARVIIDVKNRMPLTLLDGTAETLATNTQ